MGHGVGNKSAGGGAFSAGYGRGGFVGHSVHGVKHSQGMGAAYSRRGRGCGAWAQGVGV